MQQHQRSSRGSPRGGGSGGQGQSRDYERPLTFEFQRQYNNHPHSNNPTTPTPQNQQDMADAQRRRGYGQRPPEDTELTKNQQMIQDITRKLALNSMPGGREAFPISPSVMAAIELARIPVTATEAGIRDHNMGATVRRLTQTHHYLDEPREPLRLPPRPSQDVRLSGQPPRASQGQNPSLNLQKTTADVVPGSTSAGMSNTTAIKVSKMNPDDLLREFRSLECGSCHRHFGYQSRTKSDLVFCAAECINAHAGCFPGAGLLPQPQAKQSGEYVVSRVVNPQPTPTPAAFQEQQEPLNPPIAGHGTQAPMTGFGVPATQGPTVIHSSFSSGLERGSESRNGAQQQNRTRVGDGDDRGNTGRMNGYNKPGGDGERRSGGGYGNYNRGDSTGGYNGNRGGGGDSTGGYNGYRGGGGDSTGGYNNGNRGGGYSDRRGGANNYGRKMQNPSTSTHPSIADDDAEWQVNTDVVDRKPSGPDSLASTNLPQMSVTDSKVSSSVSGPQRPQCEPRSSNPFPLRPKEHKTPPAQVQSKPVQPSAPGPVPQPKRVIPTPQEVPAARIQVTPNSVLSSLGTDLAWDTFELGLQTVVSKNFANDTGDFFAQDFYKSRQSEEMINNIYAFIAAGSSLKPVSFDPKVLCLAPFVGDYYRAEIIKECTDDATKVQVFFSDFGNIENVPKEALLQIPDHLAKPPRLVIHCRWDAEIAKELSDIKLKEIFADERLSITPMVKLGPGQYIVKIGEYACNVEFEVVPLPVDAAGPQDTVVTPSAPTTPTPEPSPVAPATVAPTPVPAAETPTPIAPAPVVPAPTAVVPTPPQAASPAMPVVSVATASPSQSTSSAGAKYTLTGRPPLPGATAGAAPAQAATVPAAPSRKKFMLDQLPHSPSIQSNGEVYVLFTWSQTRYLVVGHDHNNDGEKIQGLIEQQIETCDKLVDGDLPVAGEILLAPYDGTYYRGVVKAVDSTAKTATFEFIDYGDRAGCKFDEIRVPNEEMMKTPVLGLSVVLPDVDPVKKGEEVKGVVADYINLVMQMQLLGDESIREDVEVALWVTNTMTLNSVAHKPLT